MQVYEGVEIAKPSVDANPRSFNPNTPANSPSENPGLISMGTVVTFHGKNQNCKQMRVRSSSGSNGTKNFMSPTISVASKVTASPRKKILAERNEPVRASSVSFSDLKSPSLNPTVEDPQHMTPKTQKDIDSKELLCSKNEPEEEPVCVNASDESDSVNLDPSFIPPLSCPKLSLVIATEHTTFEFAGLFSQVFAVLCDLNCNVVSAEVWTHKSTTASVVCITDEAAGRPLVEAATEHTTTEFAGWFSQVFAVLCHLKCNVVAAEFWTHKSTMASVVCITDEAAGRPIVEAAT
ncbi:PREDICTED: ACT [Prunus dulcis]|uniref:PREDICTED: ACT n=1 Tax=Prunus dulcis TaxID=3755 RepID=A0A5E4EKL7_PRUDU|nr:hypothetical protein L3X38_044116 [Prunus dulcis]VVA15560.1 PREDICTED: ACT [Prunus dulcis]